MPKLQVRLQNRAPMALNAEFDCQPGELLALVGPSGSGKSSLLRAVAGLLQSHGLSGTVQVGSCTWFDSVQGTNWSPQARRVGLVFQSYALFPHLNALANVLVGGGLAGAGSHSDRSARTLMARLGLAGLEHRLPAQLSGGQQQRVALARALLRVQPPADGGQQPMQPGVLLLDEPFSAVDAPSRQTLYRELAALRQHVSTPMVLVTHDLLEARRLADRVVILDGGSTLQSGTPAAVFSRPRNARVAQLVGIQNLFAGRFQRTGGGMARLRWAMDPDDPHAAAIELRVIDKGRIDDGARVSWVLTGDAMDVRPWPAPSAPDNAGTVEEAQVNVLACAVREVLELGETSLCTLVPSGLPDGRLMLTLASSQLRDMGTAVGMLLAVRIAPQGIHIMPVRPSSLR